MLVIWGFGNDALVNISNSNGTQIEPKHCCFKILPETSSRVYVLSLLPLLHNYEMLIKNDKIKLPATALNIISNVTE